MNWINPVKPKKYLIPVPLEELDFLPDGFTALVKKNMPFGNFGEATDEVIDSLYYSLSVVFEPFLSEESWGKINRYSSNYDINEAVKDDLYGGVDSIHICCAINPASIKAINDEKFAQTFIATRQFEKRLKSIFRTGEQKILECYTNNLSMDLSHCDSLAFNLLVDTSKLGREFNSFQNENWGNVENLPPSINKLSKYYHEQLEKVEKELEKAQEHLDKELESKSKKAEKLVEDYKKLLTKRQDYRMERNGFTLKKMGWVTVGIIVEPMTIELTVNKGDSYDRVHVYTIDPSINSIFAWQSTDKVNFNYAFAEDHIIVFKKFLKANAIAVAYQEKKPFFDLLKFTADNEVELEFNLKKTTPQELKKLLSSLDKGSKSFNKLKVDLEYQQAFYDEKERLKKLKSDNQVMRSLAEHLFISGKYSWITSHGPFNPN
jgi:hypothetical protein